MLSLALNLVLTGAFILLMKWLVARDRTPASADPYPARLSSPRVILLAHACGRGDLSSTSACRHARALSPAALRDGAPRASYYDFR